MAQYRTGTALAANGSPIVTGTATTWQSIGNISEGDLFAFTGEGVFYTIASVQNDTQLTLETNYVGATKANAIPYQIQVDFTPNNKYPTPTYGDADTASLVKQTLLQIDAQLAALSPVPGLMQGAITLAGSLEIGGSFTTTLSKSVNLLIDGNFSVNQRGYASGALAPSLTYMHDRWKAWFVPASYTYAQGVCDTLITITAGAIGQTIEPAVVAGGTYTLSWTGTALATVQFVTPAGNLAGAVADVASGASFVIPAGSTVFVIFGLGTLGLVQLEAGSAPTAFERRQIGVELALCQRYYQANDILYGFAVSESTAAFLWVGKVTMRALPTVSLLTATTYIENPPFLRGTIEPASTLSAVHSSGAGSLDLLIGGLTNLTPNVPASIGANVIAFSAEL